jgi:hypothetical protein
MNERIKQLAEQAGIHFGRSATLDGNNIARFVTTSDMEKFAELIVGECIRKINDIAESSNNPQPIYRVAVDLLEHFGVTE